MSENMLGKVVRMITTLPADWLGALVDLSEKLGSKDGQMWLASLKMFLRKENPWELKLIRRATLLIGGVSKDELLARLKDCGFYVSDWARDLIMGRIKYLKRSVKVELGWIKVRDLFNDDQAHTTAELISRIKAVGDLCPAEVGPHQRLADADQPIGEWYYVIHEPVPASDGYPSVFLVGRSSDDGRYLDGALAHHGDLWRPGNVVVFRLRK